MNMNKSDFVEYISKKNDITKVEAKKELDRVIEAISSALTEGNDISLAGFGNFVVIDVPERERRNISTGETFMAPAHKAPKFKFSKNLKDSVR